MYGQEDEEMDEWGRKRQMNKRINVWDWSLDGTLTVT